MFRAGAPFLSAAPIMSLTGHTRTPQPGIRDLSPLIGQKLASLASHWSVHVLGVTDGADGADGAPGQAGGDI